MMRQAGRYLPEYRSLREQHGFMTMIGTPEIAAEITMQPIRRFGFDAAILFSDILTVANALGCNLEFVEKKGPVIDNPVRSAADVANLSISAVRDRLNYVPEAIRLLKTQLGDTPLIGFAGAPFTVSSYMVEGGSSPDLKRVKQLMFSDPQVMEDLIDKLVKGTADYLNMQIEAGVDAIQIFDTWAGMLSWPEFQQWVLKPIKAVLNRLRNPTGVPITVFCKGTAAFWNELAGLPIQVMGLDWQVDIGAVGALARPDIALQGNLDPFMLYASPDVLDARVTHILKSMAERPGFIFNLGHGIMPDVDPAQVQRVVSLVQEFRNERIHA
jgi:uroporphyrinogen decarboxylase